MALPIGPYEGQDLRSYQEGNKFLPRQFYSLGFPNTPPPSIANPPTGITNTQAAGSYMGYPSYEAWLLAQGGGSGDGGGGGQDDIITNTYNVNQNLGPTNITDYESEAYGVGPTFKGTIARLQDAYSKLPTPGNLIMKGIRHWKQRREDKIAKDAAIEQARIDQISQQSQDNAVAAGQVQRGGGAGDSSPSHMGGISQSQADAVGAANAAAGMSGWGLAQGGRIGYNRGRVVNPGGYQGEVEESEFSIFSPKTWFSGGPESETNPTLFGTQNSLMNKTAIINLEKAIGFYEASGKLDQEQQLDYELKLKQLEALIAGSKGQAEGGLIGYFDGGIARLL